MLPHFVTAANFRWIALFANNVQLVLNGGKKYFG